MAHLTHNIIFLFRKVVRKYIFATYLFGRKILFYKIQLNIYLLRAAKLLSFVHGMKTIMQKVVMTKIMV